MATFLTDLWESIFTPGPTPTLLIATNATFAALQLLLFSLLLATSSIHFAVLSFLCGGLWYSINWFATELAAAKKKEEAAERLRARRRKDDRSRETDGAVADADDEGEDTEIEGGIADSTASLGSPTATAASSTAASATGAQTQAPAKAGASTTRQRKADDADRSGEVSTDSEWEKVDNEGRS